MSGAETIMRTAKLFEAGDYPDKQLVVHPEDLDAIAASFNQPVPIQMEHTSGPLEFGWLREVWRRGSELFGVLEFSRAAWDLVRQNGAKALSIALNRATLAIEEVSLVRDPRVPDARIFNSECSVRFTRMLETEFVESASIAAERSGESRSRAVGDACSVSSAAPAEAEKLRLELKLRNAKEELAELTAQGRIAPASEKAALALLMSDNESAVRFASGRTGSVRDAFLEFIRAQPPVIVFSETAPAGRPNDALSAEDRKLLQALGIDRQDIAKYDTEKEEN